MINALDQSTEDDWELLGTMCIKQSPEYLRRIFPIVRSIKAEQNDASIIEIREEINNGNKQ